MWFLLAGHLGRTVAELQATMGIREFIEWAAYYKLNPFGPVRGDYQAALIASTVANANRSSKQRAPKLEDFLLKFGAVVRRASPESIAAKFRMFAKAHNANLSGRRRQDGS
tara:strand:+ start:8564 stop:8896 length:333 start_codon:yes stop_codon:yes gene_type:complete